jgi:hypothetical protein
VVVANWAAGRSDSRNGIVLTDIAPVLAAALVRVERILMHLEVPYGSQASA